MSPALAWLITAACFILIAIAAYGTFMFLWFCAASMICSYMAYRSVM